MPAPIAIQMMDEHSLCFYFHSVLMFNHLKRREGQIVIDSMSQYLASNCRCVRSVELGMAVSRGKKCLDCVAE